MEVAVASEVVFDTTRSPTSSPPEVLVSTCSIVFSETGPSVEDVSVVVSSSADSFPDSSSMTGLSVDSTDPESVGSLLLSNCGIGVVVLDSGTGAISPSHS